MASMQAAIGASSGPPWNALATSHTIANIVRLVWRSAADPEGRRRERTTVHASSQPGRRSGRSCSAASCVSGCTLVQGPSPLASAPLWLGVVHAPRVPHRRDRPQLSAGRPRAATPVSAAHQGDPRVVRDEWELAKPACRVENDVLGQSIDVVLLIEPGGFAVGVRGDAALRELSAVRGGPTASAPSYPVGIAGEGLNPIQSQRASLVPCPATFARVG